MNEAMTALVMKANRDQAAARTMAMTRETADLGTATARDMATARNVSMSLEMATGPGTATSRNREMRRLRRTSMIGIRPTAAVRLATSGVLTRQNAGLGPVPRGVRGRKSRYLDPPRLQAVLLTGWAGSRRRALSQGVPRADTTRLA
jgi:hypothetical protein